MTIAEIYASMEYGPAPEAADLANAWLEAHGRSFGLFIGGEWRGGSEGKTFATLNPATAKQIAKVTQAGKADVAAAVAAARAAQPGWASLGGHERAKYLYALARQIQKHSRLFAVLETLDNGKPIRETREIDIPLVARHFYHHAGWAQLMEREMPDCAPVGVVGQIIPWNFPLLILSWKIAPAIAMGNTVILKPAEFTPLTALLFSEVCETVGLPPGVVNIVTGDGATGTFIVEHSDVDKIAFTGSTEVGRIIRKATSGTGKKISLELGGKSPFVVFDDADQDSAIEGLVDAIWFNQGQVCCAGSRLLVQEGIADRFLSKLRARMENLRVGDPLDKAVDIGAIIAPVQLERISGLVETGRKEGAEMFQPSWACPKEGWFYPPTLLSNVAPSSTVAQVEIFGPVLVSMTFRTPAEAVALANNTTYGLAASVWSENVNLAQDVAAKIKAGTVWVNCTNQFDASSGFGGYRESGYGREGGREGLWEYVRTSFQLGESCDRTDQLDQSDRPDSSAHRFPEPPNPRTSLDRTYKNYIGGKQTRPDQGYSLEVLGSDSSRLGEVGRGNRKDIRDAVEAARNAQPAWAEATAHLRAQVLYYLAENLSDRRGDFAQLVADATRGHGEPEVEATIRRLFDFAALADKFDGAVHGAAFRGVVYTLNEPLGAVGIVCPNEAPLLGFATLCAAPVAMGNAVVAVPSERAPIPAAEFVQLLETSDIPGGVWNLVTGLHEELEKPLAEHDGLDAIWHFGSSEGAERAEGWSIGNLKQTWSAPKGGLDWLAEPFPSREFVRRAVQVKNVWVPIGE